MARNNLIQFRRGTASQFSSVNPVLQSGEPGFTTDSNLLKIGDGSTPWNLLPYLSGFGISNVVDDTTPQLGGNLDLNSNNINGSGSIAIIGNVDVTGNLDIDGVGTFTQVGIGTDGPTHGFQVEQNNIVFNDGGGDYDFRVESNNDANLLFTNGGTDRIGIGTDSPTSKLDVSGLVTSSGYIVPLQSGFLKADGTVDNSIYITGHPVTDATGSVDNTGRTYIQDILLDSFGHITGVRSATETVIDTNVFVTGITYNSADHSLVLSRNSGSVTGILADIIHSGDNISFLNNDAGYLIESTQTLTSLSGNSITQELTYIDESGVSNVIDLSWAIDDTNLARLVTGIVDSSGLATFTRDDETTFNVDFSVLFDDTNLTRITSAGFDTSSGILTLSRSDATTVSVSLEGRYATTDELSSVSGYLQDQIDNLPPDTNTFVTGISYNSTTHELTLARNSGSVTGILNDVAHSGDNISIFINDSGYINTETDPIFTASVAYNITSENTGEWTEAYNWVANNSGSVLSSGDNISLLVNDAGYITGYTETDPIFTGSVAYNITSLDTGNWNSAYDWVANNSGTILSSGDNVSLLVNDANYAASGDNVSLFVNDAGYLTEHPAISDAATDSDNSGRTYIQDILLDQYGHVTGLATATETVVDTNDNVFVTGITYNSSTHSLVLSRNSGSVTGILDNIIHSGDNVSFLNNDAGYISAHPSTDATGSVDNSGRTYIQDLLLDSFGHVTGVTSATETVTDTNTFVTGIVFNSGTNNLVLSRNDDVSITGNLVGVLVSGTEYHTTISAASSSDNAGRTYIQDILLDTYGHITGLATSSETGVEAYYAGTGLTLNGVTFHITGVDTSLLVGTVDNNQLTNSSITINAGTGLTNGGTVSLGDSINIDIDETVVQSGDNVSLLVNDANYVDGSGTANYITKWSDSNTVTDSIIYDDGTNIGIGTSSPSYKLDVNGDANFASDIIVGGNLTVHGTTVTANVDTMEVEDPIITLGLASGTIVTDTSLDRGLALALNDSVMAFMGWDTSENEFSLLSSGVASNGSGNYSPGTYGSLHIAGLTATTANFSSTIYAANIGVGEDNSVVVLDSDGQLRTDEIDSRVWGTSLVDGTGSAGHVAFWLDSNTITYDSNQLYWNSTDNRLGIGTNSPQTELDVSGNLTALTGYIDTLAFNVDAEAQLLKGQISWDDTEGVVSMGLTDTLTTHIGEQRFYRIRNKTGSPLYKGQVVYATGVHSNGLITPAKYIANNSIAEVRFIGVVLETVNNNNNGYVADFGHIHQIDLRGNVASNYAVGDETWLAGDILYAHPTVAGKLTKVKPKHEITVAIILDNSSNGKMFVRPTTFGDLNDNHTVNTSGVTDGQFLQYNATTDYWVPSSSGNFTSLQLNGSGVLASGTAYHPTVSAASSSDNSGGTFIQDILLDSNGHVTGLATSVAAVSGDNISIFVNDSGYLTEHPTITAASSSDNSGQTFIQDILLDSNGHVTGLATATATGTTTSTIPKRYSITTTSGTFSSFTTDDTYTVNQIDIFQNGIKLHDGIDFTATNGSSVTLTNYAPSGSIIEYIINMTSGVVSATFSPSDISGLQLWLDADDSETITLNGSTVSQWDDKSGNNYHCVQGTASNQPTYVTAAQNGKNVVRLDGSNDYMQNSTNTIVGGSNARTVFVACKNTDTSGITYPFGLGTRANVGSGQIFLVSAEIAVRVSFGNIIWSTSLYSSAGIITIQTNGTDVNQLLGWLNGASLSLSSSTNVTLNTQVGYMIGDSTVSSTWYGDVMEVIVYDSNLSTSDRESVESYLSTKWGIS